MPPCASFDAMNGNASETGAPSSATPFAATPSPATPSSATDPRYPIGRHAAPAKPSQADRAGALAVLAHLPQALRGAVDGLTDAQLDTPYREGGWTVRQLVHHVADSHMNAATRFRLALTENDPVIKPYDEQAWALLADAATGPVEASLQLLQALHARWVLLLRQLTPEQWDRAYVHPENGRTPLSQAVLLYAWHSRHHTAHVSALRALKGWE